MLTAVCAKLEQRPSVRTRVRRSERNGHGSCSLRFSLFGFSLTSSFGLGAGVSLQPPLKKQMNDLAALARSVYVRNWRWAAIILAVVWAIAGGVLGREVAVRHGLAKATHNYEKCLANPTKRPEACQKSFWHQARRSERRPHWIAAATVGLSPIAIVWLLIWGIMAMVRRIRGSLQPSL